MFFDEISKFESNSGNSDNASYICIPDFDKSYYVYRQYGMEGFNITGIIGYLYFTGDAFTDDSFSKLACKYIFAPAYADFNTRTVGSNTSLEIVVYNLIDGIAEYNFNCSLHLNEIYTIENQDFYILIDTTYNDAYIIG